MTYFLHKLSGDGWTKQFETKDDLIDGIRSHICNLCLSGEEFDDDYPIDIWYDGVLYLCRDVSRLLSTACGCELMVEGGEFDD